MSSPRATTRIRRTRPALIAACTALLALATACTPEDGESPDPTPSAAPEDATTDGSITGDLTLSDLGPDGDTTVFPGGSAQAAVDQVEQVVDQVLADTGVPGAAVAIVTGDEVLYTGGFGVRDLTTGEPVDAETVFQIASVSKSVGATVVATQVTDGVVSWDDPSHTYLPELELSDAWVSEHVTIGDLYSHRTGLPHAAGDLLEDIGYDRTEILQRLVYQPLNPFRTSYAYANYGTTAGGEAVAHAAGTTWEDLSQDALYDPLGMTSTSSRHVDYEAAANRATLHMYLGDGEFEHVAERDPDPQSPAGGVSSTASDLALWLQLLLNDGVGPQGQELIAPEALQPAITPQSFSAPASVPQARSGSYGYGFNVGVTAGGQPKLSHSGAFVIGTGTSFVVLPGLDVAVVALTNGGPVGAAEAITASLADLAEYGEVTRDWAAGYGALFEPYHAPVGDLAEQDPPADAAAPQDLATYTGAWENDYYGEAVVSVAGETLVAELGPDGGYVLELQPWDGDTFAFVPTGENAPLGSLSSATFTVPDGTARAETMTLEFFDATGLGTWTRAN
ncbi:serine hydrolase [Serinibacter salmoneus]|uniref:CubicO group peptidase (Beta-lactamase class C family) n=1 Tax=Serinibacter salmoneus TaxID=556530 RepID=A0A2A9D1J4_9MICO|nr:serine hydrolase [Serinibacter salmoneus]PFG20557.1 CubicO group peptidase (beta-lactamase class C family) [Serinibacter salmoneus]